MHKLLCLGQNTSLVATAKRQRDKHKLTPSSERHSKLKSKMGMNRSRRFHRGCFAQSGSTAGLKSPNLAQQNTNAH